MVRKLIGVEREVSIIRGLKMVIQSLRYSPLRLCIVLVMNGIVRLFINEFYFEEVKVDLSSQ